MKFIILVLFTAITFISPQSFSKKTTEQESSTSSSSIEQNQASVKQQTEKDRLENQAQEQKISDVKSMISTATAKLNSD